MHFFVLLFIKIFYYFSNLTLPTFSMSWTGIFWRNLWIELQWGRVSPNIMSVSLMTRTRSARSTHRQKRHFTCICKIDIETTSGILKKLKLCLTITPSEIIVQRNGSCWGGRTGFQSILETNVKWRPLLQRNKGYTISEIEFM